jgi:hypothetical protein
LYCLRSATTKGMRCVLIRPRESVIVISTVVDLYIDSLLLLIPLAIKDRSLLICSANSLAYTDDIRFN